MSEQVLPDTQIEAEIANLDVAWTHIPGQGLERVFETANFAEGLVIVNKIAQVVERLGHDPEVTLRANEVDLVTTTEEAGGVTERDIELARAIDEALRAR